MDKLLILSPALVYNGQALFNRERQTESWIGRVESHARMNSFLAPHAELAIAARKALGSPLLTFRRRQYRAALPAVK